MRLFDIEGRADLSDSERIKHREEAEQAQREAIHSVTELGGDPSSVMKKVMDHYEASQRPAPDGGPDGAR